MTDSNRARDHHIQVGVTEAIGAARPQNRASPRRWIEELAADGDRVRLPDKPVRAIVQPLRRGTVRSGNEADTTSHEACRIANRAPKEAAAASPPKEMAQASDKRIGIVTERGGRRECDCYFIKRRLWASCRHDEEGLFRNGVRARERHQRSAVRRERSFVVPNGDPISSLVKIKHDPPRLPGGVQDHRSPTSKFRDGEVTLEGDDARGRPRVRKEESSAHHSCTNRCNGRYPILGSTYPDVEATIRTEEMSPVAGHIPSNLAELRLAEFEVRKLALDNRTFVRHWGRRRSYGCCINAPPLPRRLCPRADRRKHSFSLSASTFTNLNDDAGNDDDECSPILPCDS